jgi:hypothetical protein
MTKVAQKVQLYRNAISFSVLNDATMTQQKNCRRFSPISADRYWPTQSRLSLSLFYAAVDYANMLSFTGGLQCINYPLAALNPKHLYIINITQRPLCLSIDLVRECVNVFQFRQNSQSQ